jgi:hypothetical protein
MERDKSYAEINETLMEWFSQNFESRLRLVYVKGEPPIYLKSFYRSKTNDNLDKLSSMRQQAG